MKKLCVISMLVLSIVGNAFCQKTKAKYDTMTVLEGIRPPIMVNDFARKSDIYFNEEVKKNLNNLVIDFGDKNRLLIDYQGISKFNLKHNVDSLLRNFWQDYSLIRDTLKQNTVKKITYYAKNKNVNRKSVIDIQYFPQKEAFQFGKEVELVRLQQDTLVLINFDDKATAELVKTANRIFKTYQSQSFLFNLNTIDDVEDILDNNINQAIIEASERVENERKTVKPWKILGVVNDLASQRIRSKVKGNALFDFINFHADLGIGMIKGQAQGSTTLAFDIASSSYHKKGIALGIQTSFMFIEKTERTNNSLLSLIVPTYFTGITFYQRKNSQTQFKGGVFLGYSRFRDPKSNAPTANVKIFGWYQLTPLIRIQPEIGLFTYDVIDRKIKPASSTIGLRLSFGF
ncbi:hypothetical protein [Emticicia sp. W12TSBA100-4]|uniref:hypothetical protein n=1 Tax=Emticicia sp. W12TSBA100-4 TaxID=3160965 RepID=UPI003305BB17